MRFIISLIGLIMTVSLVHGMDEEKFKILISDIKEKKFGRAEEFLQKNENELRQDPEYYVVLLNYALSKGDLSEVVIAKGKPKGDDLSLKNPKSGETVGFIGQRGGYDEKLIVTGISKTKNALHFFEPRLDIHFGILAAAKRIERWDILGDQLVEILRVSKKIDNKWVWGTINSMSGNPKKFMLENIQSHIFSLFHADTPTADETVVRASQEMIRHYPDVIYGYSNLGVLYLAKKEYDKADEYLKKALKIDPNDEIVKENIELLKKNRKG